MTHFTHINTHVVEAIGQTTNAQPAFSQLVQPSAPQEIQNYGAISEVIVTQPAIPATVNLDLCPICRVGRISQNIFKINFVN